MTSTNPQPHIVGVTETGTSFDDKTGNGAKKAVIKSFRASIAFRILSAILVLAAVLNFPLDRKHSRWTKNALFTKLAAVSPFLDDVVLLDDTQLKAFDGSDPSKPIYVALNGTIYDVTPGARVYGPGGNYHMLAGKDAARAFVTGCFEDDNPDLRGAEWAYVPKDVPGLNEPATGAQKLYREQELRKARKQVQAVLDGWKQVFSGKSGKDYFEVGKVNRPVDWQSTIPIKELCEQAQKKRPATKQ